MIVHVWFRKSGASDGLWWTAEIAGVEWHCSEVQFCGPSATAWEEREGRPRAEQRHFIETHADGFRWDGPRLVLTGADSGANNG